MSIFSAVKGRFGTGTSDFDYVAIDCSTNTMPVLDEALHKINCGEAYEYTSASELGSGVTASFLITTPNTTKWGHFVYEFDSELEVEVRFYETATPDSDGTTVSAPSVINKDRNSGNTNGITLKGAPTVGAGSKGTLIRLHHTGSGKKIGGSSREKEKLILKQNTKYWVDLENLGGANNWVSWIVSWTEHTNLR